MKAVLKISIGIVLMFALCIALLLGLLASPYSSWATEKLVQHLAPEELYIQDIHYQFPDRFELKQLVVTRPSSPAITVDNTRLALDLDWNTPLHPLYIKRISFDGMNVPTGMPERLTKWLNYWRPRSIHVKHLDFASHEFVARGFEFVFTPEGGKDADTLKAFFAHGYLSAAGDQLYWKGEAFNEFKLRANLGADLIQLDQLDFTWRGGDVQLIAEKKDKSWTINDILINHLRLSASDISKPLREASDSLRSSIALVEHAKTYQSSWDNLDWQLNQVNLELINWRPQQDLWQQQAQVALSAESLIQGHMQLLEPQIELELHPQNLSVKSLELLFEQGKIELSGDIYPDQLNLSKLSVSNLEWVQEGDVQPRLFEGLNRYSDISIEQLAITRSQIISPGDNAWQVSNLNAQGTDLILRDSDQWALWNGNLSASANSLSLLGKNSLRPYVEMQSDQGHWKINELFIPIQEGLVEAQGDIDLSRTSKPWGLKIQAYGLPLDTFTPSLHLAIGWHGLADLDLDLKGLAGDDLMLKRSLDGKAKISAHDVRVQLPFDEPVLHPLIIPEIELNARRGHIDVPNISIISEDLTGEVSGSIDMAEPEQSQLAVTLSNECMSLKKSLPKGRSQLTYQCD